MAELAGAGKLSEPNPLLPPDGADTGGLPNTEEPLGGLGLGGMPPAGVIAFVGLAPGTPVVFVAAGITAVRDATSDGAPPLGVAPVFANGLRDPVDVPAAKGVGELALAGIELGPRPHALCECWQPADDSPSRQTENTFKKGFMPIE